MPFPEILLALRLSNGLSQQQLAERANVAEITIQNYESGRSNPVLAARLRPADGTGEVSFRAPACGCDEVHRVHQIALLMRVCAGHTLYKGKNGSLSASSPSGEGIPLSTCKRSCGRFCANQTLLSRKALFASAYVAQTTSRSPQWRAG